MCAGQKGVEGRNERSEYGEKTWTILERQTTCNSAITSPQGLGKLMLWKSCGREKQCKGPQQVCVCVDRKFGARGGRCGPTFGLGLRGLG